MISHPAKYLSGRNPLGDAHVFPNLRYPRQPHEGYGRCCLCSMSLHVNLTTDTRMQTLMLCETWPDLSVSANSTYSTQWPAEGRQQQESVTRTDLLTDTPRFLNYYQSCGSRVLNYFQSYGSRFLNYCQSHGSRFLNPRVHVFNCSCILNWASTFSELGLHVFLTETTRALN